MMTICFSQQVRGRCRSGSCQKKLWLGGKGLGGGGRVGSSFKGRFMGAGVWAFFFL
jgi:hypothetical protein